MRPNNNLLLYQFCRPFVVVVFLSCSLCLAQQADKEISRLPDAPKQSIPEMKGFFARWAEFYRHDWSGTTGSSPAQERRGFRRHSIRRYSQMRIGRMAVPRSLASRTQTAIR